MAQDVQHKLAVYRSKRDFHKTREPRGDEVSKQAQQLAFVVQKHNASHLHYDLRLEVHGVMKSWAVPKGPSLDPKIKRLAVEVEDHPISYNTFEGTIPAGQYGAGTVILWDEGTYTVNDVPPGEKPEETMEERIAQGKVSITFHGKRLRGAFKLLRMARRGRSKAQWLLIKQKDACADPTFDPARDEPSFTKAELRPMLVSTAEELRDDKLAQDIHGAAAKPQSTPLLQAIRDLPHSGGILSIADDRLSLSHLDRVFFPKPAVTKRAILEYYASMMDLILPWMNDRPLVLKRYPHGIGEKGFYQQEPDANAPGRIELLDSEQGRERRLIGGEAITLLYLAQIGAISYDPWHARMGHLPFPDYSIIDLDPGPETPFASVRAVAAACLEVLDDLGINGAMKTSGATGIHIYLPLPPETSWETSLLIAQLICTLIHQKVPRLSTLERSVRKRPKGSVLLDSGQNHLTRSVAGVWSLRAEPLATVSTPITAQDLDDGVEPADFTIATPLRERRDFWERPMAQPIAMEKILSAAP